MLTHVVMMKLKDPEADAPRLAKELNALHGQIPGLLSMSAGADVVRSERSWDLVLVSEFADREALAAYGVHPAHVAVAEQIKTAKTDISSVDFES